MPWFVWQVCLFAGRRSTDRLFLLLQNVFCAHHLPGYIGTSSVFAVKKIDDAFAASGIALQDRKSIIGEFRLDSTLFSCLRDFVWAVYFSAWSSYPTMYDKGCI